MSRRNREYFRRQLSRLPTFASYTVTCCCVACGIDDRKVAVDTADVETSPADEGAQPGDLPEGGAGETSDASMPADLGTSSGAPKDLPGETAVARDGGSDALAPVSNSGRLLWASYFTDRSVNGLAFDALQPDLLVATGSFSGSVLFGNATFPSNGDSDGYLARFSKDDGTYVSAVRFGSIGSEYPLGIVGAPDGSFALVGSYTGQPNFGASDHAASPEGLFVAVYGNYLQLRWAKTFGTARVELPGKVLDVDGSSAPMIAGSFQGSIDFGSGEVMSAGQSDALFARFRGSDGLLEQTMPFASLGNEGGNSAHFLLGNNVVAGTFTASLALGAGPELVSRGAKDIFLAAFSNAGTYQWRIGIGGELDDGGVFLAHDRAGHLYVCGSFQQTLQIGSFSLETHGGTDIFLARVSPIGVVEWAVSFGGGGNDEPRGLSASPAGELVIGGAFTGEVDFGGGERPSAGGSDAFVASYDSLGDYRWDHSYGAALDDRTNGVLMDDEGSAFANVSFSGTVDFGQGLVAAGDTSDSAILRYSP